MEPDSKDLLKPRETVKLVKFDCPTHGAVEVKIFDVSGNGWNEPECQKCKELAESEKAEQAALDKKVRLANARRKQIEKTLGDSGIPKRFLNKSFNDFVPENDTAKNRRDVCYDYAFNFPENRKAGRSLIFCGTTGTGKSHLSCAIANYIIENHSIENRGCTAVFMKVSKAIRKVKETYSRDSKMSEQEAINWFRTPDLLILDEVGVQFGTEAEKYILFEIINERYENMLPTILLSNLALKGIIEYVGERVVDRMKEGGGNVLIFDWKSHRGVK